MPLADVADVIAPDFRGFGDSDKPDLPPAEGTRPACWPMTSSPCWMA